MKREWCVRKYMAMLVSLVMIVTMTGCASKEEEPVQPVVQVKAGELKGSGVVFAKNEEQLVILTAGHVLEEMPESVEVVFGDGFKVTCSSYVTSRTTDMGFINIESDAIPEKKWSAYEAVPRDKESFDMLAEGEKMILRGILEDGEMQQLDSSLIYPWIYVEDFQQYMMLLRGELLTGMSGGGAFDENGNFVGILCGFSEEREIAVVPLSLILAEYTLVYG